jgi:MSHA biogenesis protein MshK
MDQHLVATSLPARRLLAAGCALLGLLWPAAAAAQSLADPTRPPTHLIDPARGGMAQGEVSANPLQSIIRSGKTRKALINGELVKVGDAVGAAVVESIGDAEVVLRQEDGSKETLKLYPDVEISKSKTKQRVPAGKPAGAKP